MQKLRPGAGCTKGGLRYQPDIDFFNSRRKAMTSGILNLQEIKSFFNSKILNFIMGFTRYRRKNEQLDQCCQQLVAMLCCTLSTTIVHSCSRSTTIVQSLLTTINKLFLSTIVGSCSNNVVTIVVLCQHRTTIDRTILINIVNSTSVAEP